MPLYADGFDDTLHGHCLQKIARSEILETERLPHFDAVPLRGIVCKAEEKQSGSVSQISASRGFHPRLNRQPRLDPSPDP